MTREMLRPAAPVRLFRKTRSRVARSLDRLGILWPNRRSRAPVPLYYGRQQNEHLKRESATVPARWLSLSTLSQELLPPARRFAPRFRPTFHRVPALHPAGRSIQRSFRERTVSRHVATATAA